MSVKNTDEFYWPKMLNPENSRSRGQLGLVIYRALLIFRQIGPFADLDIQEIIEEKLSRDNLV